jgi:hypothetical protein
LLCSESGVTAAVVVSPWAEVRESEQKLEQEHLSPVSESHNSLSTGVFDDRIVTPSSMNESFVMVESSDKNQDGKGKSSGEEDRPFLVSPKGMHTFFFNNG